jgi:hypothetical protein
LKNKSFIQSICPNNFAIKPLPNLFIDLSPLEDAINRLLGEKTIEIMSSECTENMQSI